ncbi:uncharacterized protein C2845_PM12G10730 [Panicum miliaceum]|uniref:F-box domain-containing protein n=1 Tax=Panicum miliaceum TaxID=4540 RepID=A0A3L6QHP3_PANMI|nr:uncharacterized protein C2845_PM12G10730 [Panicum miliaceum]
MGDQTDLSKNRRPAGCDVLRLKHEPLGRDTPERRDWAELPRDLAAEIGGRLDLTEYTRFRAVCKPWRRSTDDPRALHLHSRFLPRDWVVLRSFGEDDDTRCSLLNVATGASTAGVDLPDLSGHRPLGYAGGFLVLLNTTSSAISLLNPLTRAVTDLPDISPVLANASSDALDGACRFSWGFGVIDGGAVAAASPPAVVLLLREVPLLACIRIGEPRWALVDTSELAGDLAKSSFQSVLSLHGRFYVSTSTGDVLTVELHPEPRLAYVIRQSTTSTAATLPATCSFILAPSGNDDGAGMLMLRATMSDDWEHPEVQVFEVDVGGRKLTLTATVGAGRALFVGSHRTLSISTRLFPSIAANANAVCFRNGQGLLFRVFYNYDGRGEPALEMRLLDQSEEGSCFGPFNLDVYLACCVDFLHGTV